MFILPCPKDGTSLEGRDLHGSHLYFECPRCSFNRSMSVAAFEAEYDA